MANHCLFPFFFFGFEQEALNPHSNIQSFDAIYYAALQVVIVASANGVSGSTTYSLR